MAKIASFRHKKLLSLRRSLPIERQRGFDMKRISLLMLLLPGLTACTSLQRSPQSGYATSLASAEPMTSSSPRGRLHSRLAAAEKNLRSKNEREQYYKHRSLMNSDRERLEFLSLATPEERARWLRAREISHTQPRFSAEHRKLIEENDIAIGMSRQAVRASWGAPEKVEVAGQPIYGHERWTYLEQISSPEGYQTETRTIYFEYGVVVGWDRNKDRAPAQDDQE